MKIIFAVVLVVASVMLHHVAQAEWYGGGPVITFGFGYPSPPIYYPPPPVYVQPPPIYVQPPDDYDYDDCHCHWDHEHDDHHWDGGHGFYHGDEGW